MTGAAFSYSAGATDWAALNYRIYTDSDLYVFTSGIEGLSLIQVIL